MTTKPTIRDLMQWRLARAEAEAPSPPRATRLLDLIRPWWEVYPEKFQAIVKNLTAIQMGYGHAKVEPGLERAGHVVPALIVGPDIESEASVQVLYFDLRQTELRLRLELGRTILALEAGYEITFISTENKQPLFSAMAQRSVENEYWIHVSIPENVSQSWQGIRVMDPMPFRLILRPDRKGS